MFFVFVLVPGVLTFLKSQQAWEQFEESEVLVFRYFSWVFSAGQSVGHFSETQKGVHLEGGVWRAYIVVGGLWRAPSVGNFEERRDVSTGAFCLTLL